MEKMTKILVIFSSKLDFFSIEMKKLISKWKKWKKWQNFVRLVIKIGFFFNFFSKKNDQKFRVLLNDYFVYDWNRYEINFFRTLKRLI